MDLISNPKRTKSDSNDIYNGSFNGNHINGFKNGNGHKEKDAPNDSETEKTKEIAKSYLTLILWFQQGPPPLLSGIAALANRR